jgi:hypothetical protein
VIDCLADTQIYIEVGFGVRLGIRVIPTFALRLPPAEVQGALQGGSQGYRFCLSAFQTSLCGCVRLSLFTFVCLPQARAAFYCVKVAAGIHDGGSKSFARAAQVVGIISSEFSDYGNEQFVEVTWV